MGRNPASDIEAFKRTLTTRAHDYTCSPEPPESRISVRFLGRFENREVLWNMTLYTVARYYADHELTTTAPRSQRQILHIRSGSDDTFEIDVAIATPIIDEPTIRKTIVMIRNYKRLAFGKHEWGKPQAL